MVDEPAGEPVFLLPVGLDLPHEILIALNASGPADETGTGSGVVLAVPTGDGARDMVLVAVEEVVGPQGADDLVLEVARTIDPSARGADVLGEVPEGHVVAAAGHVSGDAAAIDETNWTLSVDVHGQRLQVTASSAPAEFGPVFAAMIGTSGWRTIGVRGTTGAWTTRVTEFEATDDAGTMERRTTVLSWPERPGLSITIRGDAEIDTLVEVAESLAEVSGGEFDSHHPDDELTEEPG